MSLPTTLDPQVRSFFARVLAFGALQALIFAWVWCYCPRVEDHYATASIDKHDLLRSTQGRRVILVGGSNVAFGYHSELFRDYGLAPVNMGLNVGLGISFFVREVEDSLRGGRRGVKRNQRHFRPRTPFPQLPISCPSTAGPLS